MYVSGVPDPPSTSITWFKLGPGGNRTELKEPTVNFSSDHRTLVLSGAQDSDGGTYICIVTQNSIPSYPSAGVTMRLAVTRKKGKLLKDIKTPYLNDCYFIMLPAISANITVSCSPTVQPAPNITWCTPRLFQTSPLPVIVGTAAGGGATLVLVTVALCVYIICCSKPRKGATPHVC